MEAHERPRPLPVEPAVGPHDPVACADFAEVEAAVALVRSGAAVRVRLVGLCDAAGIAGAAAARVQAAGLSFRLDPHDPSASLIIGPRL